MIKESAKFHPHLRSNPDTKMYDKLITKYIELNGETKELKRIRKNKREVIDYLQEAVWIFFYGTKISNIPKYKLENRLSEYFVNHKKMGHTLLRKAFIPSSYEKREPHNVGFIIEIADMICKYIEGDLDMTFYKWTNSTSPHDLEKYLTDYHKEVIIENVEDLYQINKKSHPPKKKGKKKKKIRDQINMIGKDSKYIKKQIKNYYHSDNSNPK